MERTVAERPACKQKLGGADLLQATSDGIVKHSILKYGHAISSEHFKRRFASSISLNRVSWPDGEPLQSLGFSLEKGGRGCR